jgi:PBP1b-binding outer membrane lipoprotein LpoB
MLFISIIWIPAVFPQTPNPASINNMIDDAVNKAVGSLVSIDTKIKTIAIWNIEASSESPIDVASLEKSFTRSLIKANNYSRFTVIDGTVLQMRSSELNLEFSKVIDRSKMIEIGKALDIDAFLYGSAALGDEEVILTLNLVSTQTGALVWWDEIRGQDPVLIAKREQEAKVAQLALEKEQAAKKLKSKADATLRSLLLPGLGQLYTENNSRGISYFFIEGIAWVILFQDVISDSNNGDTTQRSISFALIGTNHIVSAIDAGLSAQHYNAQLKSKYNLSLELHQSTKQLLLTYRCYF